MSSIQDFLCIFPFTKEEKENATLLLSSDESMAFVAVPNSIGGEGAVYVFTRIGPLWGHSQRLTAEDGQSGGHFGKHVSLSDDGLLFVNSENKTSDNGQAYCFKHNGELWELCTPHPDKVKSQKKDDGEEERVEAFMKFLNEVPIEELMGFVENYMRDTISKTRQPGPPTTDMAYVFSESDGPQRVQRQSQQHVEQSTNMEPCMSKQSPMENQAQAFTDQHTTQGETMNDKQKQQTDIHTLLSETILNKSVEEVKTLFSAFCSAAVSKGMIDQNVAAHLHNLFGTYTKVPKGSTFQSMNPQVQPFAPMPPFMPMGFQQSHFPQPLNMGFQGLHPSQFQNPQAFRPNLPNQGARYEAERTLQQLDSQLAQTMMQLQQLEQAVENNKFHQTSLNAQCAAIRNILNSTSGK